MAIPHAAPATPVSLLPEGGDTFGSQTEALVKTEEFEAIRLVIPAGNEVCREHRVEGPITLQCLQGEIAFSADQETHDVREGQWLFLPGGVPHSITGVKDAVVLLTVIFA